MARKLITVDIDDVVADSTEAFRLAVNEHTGAALTPQDYRVPHTSYNRYYEHVWKSHGLTVIYEEVSLPMQVDQAHVALVAGAEEALLKLSKRYDIAFVTARPISWENATHIYVDNKLKGVKANIHFTERHEGVSKGQICRELGASWHIDNNPDHCQTGLEEGIPAVLFGDYGWHYKVPLGAVHCKDWQKVLEFLDERS